MVDAVKDEASGPFVKPSRTTGKRTTSSILSWLCKKHRQTEHRKVDRGAEDIKGA